MNITEIATIAQMLLDSTEKDKSNPNRPAMPEYFTAHAPSNTIQFMARSFEDVESWSEYLEAEYEYWVHVDKPGDMPHAFARTVFKSSEYVGGKGLTFTLEVFHNERLMPNSGYSVDEFGNDFHATCKCSHPFTDHEAIGKWRYKCAVCECRVFEKG